MDINKLIQGVNCTCKRHHTCDIKYVYIENGATKRLTEITKNYGKILLVADENTYAAAGERTVNALCDKEVEKVIFDGKTVLVPNETAIERVTRKTEECELIVGVGSGVIQDLCKYVSHFSDIPYIIVATAPSMDGYASDGAAMITNGMKVTYKAGLPTAIIADTEVLKNAPMDMIKSGYGDIIGKFSALNDWKLSHTVNGEYFCEYIYDLTYTQIKRTLNLADGIVTRDEKSIKTLTEALVTIGILMSFAGSSRPASGSEHHLSHFFEITGIIDGTNYFPHGTDVAYSTVITAKLREEILSRKFPEKIFREPPENLENNLTRIYKEVADGCISLQKNAGNYSAERSKIYNDKQTEIREILKEMPTADEILQMLSKVNLDISEFFSLYGDEKIKDALLYAKDLKDRYTVLWLWYDLFGGENLCMKI